MPKVVNHDERRVEIAHATWAAVQSVGVDNLTLRDITLEAGFSTGVLTHYFRDKDSVLRFAFTIAYRKTFERILNANKSVDSDLMCIRNAMAELLPDPNKPESVAFVSMCFAIRNSNDPLLAEEYNANKNEYRDLLKKYITNSIEKEEIPRVRKTEDVLDLILAVVDGVCIQSLLSPEVYTKKRCVRIIESMVERLPGSSNQTFQQLYFKPGENI